MIRIVSLDIVDLLPFPSGILFALRENGKPTFYSFDTDSGSIASVTRNAYLLTKFGSSFSEISQQLEDVFSCDAVKLWNGQTFVIYSSGEIGIFDEKGDLLRTGEITYRNSPARDAAADDNCIWCTVPEQNALIKYSTVKNRVVMRIGGDSSGTFSSPCSVDRFDNKLYVCNPGSNKINRVDPTDFSVEDFRHFDEPVYKYISLNGREFVILASGVYML